MQEFPTPGKAHQAGGRSCVADKGWRGRGMEVWEPLFLVSCTLASPAITKVHLVCTLLRAFDILLPAGAGCFFGTPYFYPHNVM